MKRLIAEFEEQSFTQIIFPHEKTDWNSYLLDAQKNFTNIIEAVAKYQKCLVVCNCIKDVQKHFKNKKNLYFIEYESNDTWARDCSVLCIRDTDEIKLLNFKFNAWGKKFEYKKDDAMSREISKHYSKEMIDIDFVLEGGGIECNSKGILITTAATMLNKNRNPKLNAHQITTVLKKNFGLKDVIYLKHGYLAGDDTDSHIDTLVRFADDSTLMYVKCENKKDEHYKELKKMENELREIASKYNFRLIALPMPDAIYNNKERLPGTYANFLFLNNAILLPVYGVKQDKIAFDVFKNFFTNRDIVPIECSSLIKEHGSLHCVTMNFAKGVEIVP